MKYARPYSIFLLSKLAYATTDQNELRQKKTDASAFVQFP